MVLEIKNPKKGARVVKQLQRKQARTQADNVIGIPDAGKRLEKLEKKVAEQAKVIVGLRVTVDKLWAWKMESEMRE